MEIRHRALEVLRIVDPAAKAAGARALYAAAQDGLILACEAQIQAPPDLPGRPDRPRLVAAIKVANRSPFTPAGRAGLIHAICHIEFNAIKIALNVGTCTRDCPVRPVGLLAQRRQSRPCAGLQG